MTHQHTHVYSIHMNRTVCKEKHVLLRADGVSIGLMDVVCNLSNEQLKFLTNIRVNSNCIITVQDELLGGGGACENYFWATCITSKL